MILLLSILVTTGAGVYISQEQSWKIMSENSFGQPGEVANIQHTQDMSAYPEREQYQTIVLENITSALQGSNPETLALNALADKFSAEGKREIEVVYPEPNQALVKITQLPSDDGVEMINYRLEMTTFGRSLLVSSPPMWQIVWAGSQIQCSAGSSREQKLAESCE
ncbi:hypothetical protein VB620_08085 [Nodularia harveyana UHCC-0300]|uniref:Uncharacterized protein n=1 Tax=Nodularia harveyana UHCC-0300 TaxID=2974287 RepID=A0ABU5UFR4_9CYAN|nr:hypothetical protein [Nodularia harveyana UHCC-0300]